MANTEAPHANTALPLTWGMKVIMLCGGIAPGLALIGIIAVLPQIETALAQDATDKMLVKLLMTIVGLTMVIGAPLAGYLVDRFSLRSVLLTNCLIYAVAGTAGLYLDSLSALLVSRLFLGITAAGIAIIGMTLINTRLQGIDRAKWMGAHIAVTMVATIILHPAIGYLGGYGWRWPFALYALGLILAYVAAFGIGNERSQTQKPTSNTTLVAKKLIHWFPFRYAVLAFIVGSITYLPMVYAPFVIKDAGVSSPMIISMVLLADSIIGATVAMLFGWSQKYLSSRTAFLISFSFTTSGMLLVSTSSSLTGVVVGMIVFGFGIGWFVPNLMTASTKKIDAALQGRAIGLVKGAHYLAAPLAVVLVEPITRAMGPKGAMWVAATLSLLAFTAFAYRSFSSKAQPSINTDSSVVTE